MEANNISLQTKQINGLEIRPLGQGVKNAAATPVKTFGDVFSNALDSSVRLQFSKHASTRLNSREINLSGEQLKRVEEGVDKARGKGIIDSLVLVDGYALVVNTKSRTVITAMQSGQKSDGIFTNIDGAVIV